MLLAVASRVQVSSCRTIRAAKVANRAAISLTDLADLVDDAEMASAEHPGDAEGEGAPARRQDDLLDRCTRPPSRCALIRGVRGQAAHSIAAVRLPLSVGLTAVSQRNTGVAGGNVEG
jgi:hypothetical protein